MNTPSPPHRASMPDYGNANLENKYIGPVGQVNYQSRNHILPKLQLS